MILVYIVSDWSVNNNYGPNGNKKESGHGPTFEF
jgi:hypothetical protein